MTNFSTGHGTIYCITVPSKHNISAANQRVFPRASRIDRTVRPDPTQPYSHSSCLYPVYGPGSTGRSGCLGLRQQVGFKDCRFARSRKRYQKDQRDRRDQCRHPQVRAVLEGQPSTGREQGTRCVPEGTNVSCIRPENLTQAKGVWPTGFVCQTGSRIGTCRVGYAEGLRRFV